MAFVLLVTPRTITGKKVELIRNDKSIPGVLYGFKSENQLVQVPIYEFEKVYEQARESQVVQLNVGEKDSIDVLIKDVQVDPVTKNIIHVDFQAIDINQPLEVEVPLLFIGEAPAVKLTGGALLKKIHTLTISCKPKDLIPFIEVKLEVLGTLEDKILVQDLIVPETMTVLNNLQELVAMVLPLKVETDKVVVAAGQEIVPEGEEKKEGAESDKKVDASGKKE